VVLAVSSGADNQGEGVASATPRPGSARAAAIAALDRFGYDVAVDTPAGIGRRRVLDLAADALASFAEEQRLVGAVKAHDSFDGILAEHALALEEARDMLGEGLDTGLFDADEQRTTIQRATGIIDDQITYVRTLGSVAELPSKEDTSGAG
jgi:hypothetical protein